MNKPIEVRLDPEYEIVWLSLHQLSEVFGRDNSVTSRDIEIQSLQKLQKPPLTAKPIILCLNPDPARKDVMARLIMNMLTGCTQKVGSNKPCPGNKRA